MDRQRSDGEAVRGFEDIKSKLGGKVTNESILEEMDAGRFGPLTFSALRKSRFGPKILGRFGPADRFGPRIKLFRSLQ